VGYVIDYLLNTGLWAELVVWVNTCGVWGGGQDFGRGVCGAGLPLQCSGVCVCVRGGGCI
jgi:hypothetical protein